MEPLKCTFSPARRRRLEAQGFQNYSDAELLGLAPGIRFAYGLCTLLMAVGLLLGSTTVLCIAMAFAIGGAVLPQHPFDYFYNGMVRHFFGLPAVPLRTPQARFACGIAALWLGGVVWLLDTGATQTAHVLGSVLVAVATLVTTTDFCIPSLVYNAIFGKRVEQ